MDLSVIREVWYMLILVVYSKFRSQEGLAQHLTITLRLRSSPYSIAIACPCCCPSQAVPSVTEKMAGMSWQISTERYASVDWCGQQRATIDCFINKIK